MAEVKTFVHTHLADHTPGSLYISGPPGTGKTVCVDLVLGAGGDGVGATVVRVNCVDVATPQGIYGRVAAELGVEVQGKGGPARLRGVVEQRLTTGEDTV